MIWVFDSWMWGMLTLQYLQKELPQAKFLYLGDTKYVPYGWRETLWIHDRTFECIEWMFDQGCVLVILACNTASAAAIRSRQELYPEKKVLSVTVPGVEAVIRWWYRQPLLFATQATIDGNIYSSVMKKRYPDMSCMWTWVVWEWVVSLIETWQTWSALHEKLWEIFSDITLSDHDVIVLWCTHYPLIEDQLRQIVWTDIPFIDAWAESAHALVSYLEQHLEIDVKQKTPEENDLMVVTQLWGWEGYVGCEKVVIDTHQSNE